MTRIFPAAAIAAAVFAPFTYVVAEAQTTAPSSSAAARVIATPLPLHGPFVLSARHMAAIPRSRSVVNEDEDGYESPPGPVCADLATCVSSSPGEPKPPGPPPGPPPQPPIGLLTNTFTIAPSTLGVTDPQIAAGPVYLATTQRNRFAIFDKSGALVTQNANGTPMAFPIDLCALFKPLLGSLNANIKLPGGGIDVAHGFGFDCTTFPNDTFYDARMVWDDYRHRYWIGALAINQKTPGNKEPGKSNPVIAHARRGKFVVAVSKTDDPRGGWNEYWFDSIKDDGKCNPACLTEQGSDYPTIGIAPHFFLEESGAGPKGGTYRHVAVVDADIMAKGTACTPCSSFEFTNFLDTNGQPWTASITPATHHGTALHDATFVSTVGSDRLALWELDFVGGAPIFSEWEIGLAPFTGPQPVLQRGKATIPNPSALKLNNAGVSVMKAVVQGPTTTATFAVCVVWSGSNTCTTAVRLVQVAHFPFAPFTKRIDRTFGRSNVLDPVGTVAGYADPEVEVNADNDIAVTYLRSGKTIFPEARVSTFLHNASDISPSQQIAQGTSPIGGTVAKGAGPCCNIDTGGISVDGSDDGGIWMMHGYGVTVNASSGTYGLAVGKVFGSKHADLVVTGLSRKAAVGSAGSSRQYRLEVTVRNQGDGPSRATAGSIARTPALRRATTRRRFDVPGLPSGRSVKIPVVLTVRAGVRLGSVRVTIVPQPRHAEYSSTNNVVVRKVL